MYQKPRKDAEEAAFRTALSQMQILYAHQKTLSYLLSKHPEWTVAPSWDCKEYLFRGWPNFERRVTMLLKLSSSVAWKNVVDVGTPDAKKLVPLTPEAFEKLLTTLAFTNGADTEVVAGLYQKTIDDALSQTTSLRFVKEDWGDSEIRELVQVLPLCKQLRRLALDENPKMTSAAARTLAKALKDGAAPNLTHLGIEAGLTGTSALAKSRELKAACDARGIECVRFAGLIHQKVKAMSANRKGKWRQVKEKAVLVDRRDREAHALALAV